ncbi:MAG: LLM class flavin-dependent oxidoreductase, partial [Acidimicrobiales bacterium]|nr:LLM class flavin-dependent oxidoreductase [Acidimicrobiales bacterium]
MARIKFGIFPITEDWPDGADMARVYNEIVAEARLAESVGFDSCLITEHHQQADGYFPNPLMVSAGVARSTTTLKVGSCVALAPLYKPIRLTEDAALLDVISGGRLILGLGASYVSEDLAAFGVDVSQRGALMEDTVRFLQEAWTHDNLDFDGEVFHFKNMRVTPKPVQQPRPPVWLGAWTPQGLRRAGRLCDAWVTDVINTLPTFNMFAEIYRKS